MPATVKGSSESAARADVPSRAAGLPTTPPTTTGEMTSSTTQKFQPPERGAAAAGGKTLEAPAAQEDASTASASAAASSKSATTAKGRAAAATIRAGDKIPYVDFTETLFSEISAKLDHADMICGAHFRLYDAMSACVAMHPKMDNGMFSATEVNTLPKARRAGLLDTPIGSVEETIANFDEVLKQYLIWACPWAYGKHFVQTMYTLIVLHDDAAVVANHLLCVLLEPLLEACVAARDVIRDGDLYDREESEMMVDEEELVNALERVKEGNRANVEAGGKSEEETIAARLRSCSAQTKERYLDRLEFAKTYRSLLQLQVHIGPQAAASFVVRAKQAEIMETGQKDAQEKLATIPESSASSSTKERDAGTVDREVDKEKQNGGALAVEGADESDDAAAGSAPAAESATGGAKKKKKRKKKAAAADAAAAPPAPPNVPTGGSCSCCPAAKPATEPSVLFKELTARRTRAISMAKAMMTLVQKFRAEDKGLSSAAAEEKPDSAKSTSTPSSPSSSSSSTATRVLPDFNRRVHRSGPPRKHMERSLSESWAWWRQHLVSILHVYTDYHRFIVGDTDGDHGGNEKGATLKTAAAGVAGSRKPKAQLHTTEGTIVSFLCRLEFAIDCHKDKEPAVPYQHATDLIARSLAWMYLRSRVDYAMWGVPEGADGWESAEAASRPVPDGSTTAIRLCDLLEDVVVFPLKNLLHENIMSDYGVPVGARGKLNTDKLDVEMKGMKDEYRVPLKYDDAITNVDEIVRYYLRTLHLAPAKKHRKLVHMWQDIGVMRENACQMMDLSLRVAYVNKLAVSSPFQYFATEAGFASVAQQVLLGFPLGLYDAEDLLMIFWFLDYLYECRHHVIQSRHSCIKQAVKSEHEAILASQQQDIQAEEQQVLSSSKFKTAASRKLELSRRRKEREQADRAPDSAQGKVEARLQELSTPACDFLHFLAEAYFVKGTFRLLYLLGRKGVTKYESIATTYNRFHYRLRLVTETGAFPTPPGFEEFRVMYFGMRHNPASEDELVFEIQNLLGQAKDLLAKSRTFNPPEFLEPLERVILANSLCATMATRMGNDADYRLVFSNAHHSRFPSLKLEAVAKK